MLPAAIGAEAAYALLVAGLANGLTLGAGALVQPSIKRLEDRRRMAGAYLGLGLGASVALGGALAVVADSAALLLVLSPLCGVAYGAALVSGLRETERLAGPAERAATISIYLAMTYVGFSLPYLVSLLEPALGTDGALLALAPLALACAARSAVRVAKPTYRCDSSGGTRLLHRFVHPWPAFVTSPSVTDSLLLGGTSDSRRRRGDDGPAP